MRPQSPDGVLGGETDFRAHARVSDTKLAAIHAQETRVTPRISALRLRVTSQMPPISTLGGHARVREQQTVSLLGRIPSARISNWGALAMATSAAEMALLPEETESVRKSKAIAEKVLRAGTRALLYGSLAAVAGVAGGSMLAASWLDIRSRADMQCFLQRSAGPRVDRLRTQLAPWKAWGERVGGGGGMASISPALENSVIVREFRRKFRVRQRVEEPPAPSEHGGSAPVRS